MFDVHLFVSFCFSFQNIDICHPVFHLGVILKCNKSFLFLRARFENLCMAVNPPQSPPLLLSIPIWTTPLMFFKQAPSKVCISIFFSVALIFAPHLYFAEGNRKAYICVCVGTTGHWHSLSRQHSHSQRGALLSQPTANLLNNKYKYRKVLLPLFLSLGEA